jgi:hypothetical protein
VNHLTLQITMRKWLIYIILHSKLCSCYMKFDLTNCLNFAEQYQQSISWTDLAVFQPHPPTPWISRLPHRTRWPGPPGPHRSPRALTSLTCSASHGSHWHPGCHHHSARARLRPSSPRGRLRSLFHSPARGLTRRMRHCSASRPPPPSAHVTRQTPLIAPLVTQITHTRWPESLTSHY